MAWRQGQSYSEDLRARVLAAVDGGMAARSGGQAIPGQRVVHLQGIDPPAAHRRSERQRAAGAPAAQAVAGAGSGAGGAYRGASGPHAGGVASLACWPSTGCGCRMGRCGRRWPGSGCRLKKDAPRRRAEPAPAQAGDRTDIAARRRTWQCTTMPAEDVTPRSIWHCGPAVWTRQPRPVGHLCCPTTGRATSPASWPNGSRIVRSSTCAAPLIIR